MTWTVTDNDIDTFVAGYIECALWSSVDDEGTPFDGTKYDDAEVADSSRAKVREVCADFLKANAEDIGFGLIAQAGHDFWLTRNGHGAGFWDRPDDYWPKPVRDRLTAAAKAYGSSYVYQGDDGQLYIE